MKLRTPEGNGEPPTGLMLAAAGAGAAAGMASRCTVFFFSFSSVLAAAGLAGSVMLATLRAISRASSSAGSFGCDTRANWTEAGAATDTCAGAAIEREIRAWVPWLPRRRCNACAGDTAAAALRWTVAAAAGRRSTAAGLRSPVRSCAIERRPPITCPSLVRLLPGDRIAHQNRPHEPPHAVMRLPSILRITSLALQIGEHDPLAAAVRTVAAAGALPVVLVAVPRTVHAAALVGSLRLDLGFGLLRSLLLCGADFRHHSRAATPR